MKYAFWTGSNWNTQIVNGDNEFSYWVGLDTSLALDSNDNPHISFYSIGYYSLKYASWTGDSWSVKTVDCDSYFDTSLALDSNDNPHISYYDDFQNSLKYAFWTGSNWSIQTVESGGMVSKFRYTSLALDSNDNPHISYYDAAYGDLKYATKGDGGNQPPNKPTCRYVKNSDELVVSTTDPDCNKVRYGVSWNNDGNVDQWTELVPSGTIKRIDCEGRTGNVGVIAEDEHGAQSQWVSVKSKNKPSINTPFLNFLQQYPLIYQLLQRLLRL